MNKLNFWSFMPILKSSAESIKHFLWVTRNDWAVRFPHNETWLFECYFSPVEARTGGIVQQEAYLTYNLHSNTDCIVTQPSAKKPRNRPNPDNSASASQFFSKTKSTMPCLSKPQSDRSMLNKNTNLAFYEIFEINKH
jgi:hypothetical protein